MEEACSSLTRKLHLSYKQRLHNFLEIFLKAPVISSEALILFSKSFKNMTHPYLS